MLGEQIEANHRLFLVLLQVYRQGLMKKELEQAFGGDTSVVSFRTPPQKKIPRLWALAS